MKRETEAQDADAVVTKPQRRLSFQARWCNNKACLTLFATRNICPDCYQPTTTKMRGEE